MLTARRIQDENTKYNTSNKYHHDQENPNSVNIGGKHGLKSAKKAPLGGLSQQAPRRALGDITNATPVSGVWEGHCAPHIWQQHPLNMPFHHMKSSSSLACVSQLL